jgi:hypothetical protein
MLFIPIIPSQAAKMAREPHCAFVRLKRLANADQMNTPMAAPITVLSKPGVTHSGRLSPPSCAQSQNDQVPQCGIADTLADDQASKRQPLRAEGGAWRILPKQRHATASQ